MHYLVDAPTPQRYRTIWLSDVHLGMPGIQTDRLLDFLRRHDTRCTRNHVDCGDSSPLCFRFDGPARAGSPATAHAGGVAAGSRRLSAATPPVCRPPLSHPGGMAALTSDFRLLTSDF
jgi:hypothetical protein